MELGSKELKFLVGAGVRWAIELEEKNQCKISGWSWSQRGWNIWMELVSNGLEY
jgi:hypothetical protein